MLNAQAEKREKKRERKRKREREIRAHMLKMCKRKGITTHLHATERAR